MKTISDYCREWDELAETTKDPYIIRKPVYVVFHFLEDIGASDPWTKQAQERISAALQKMPEQEQQVFYKWLDEVRKAI